MADRTPSCAAFIGAPTQTQVDREQLAQLLSTAAASFRSIAILAPLQRRLGEFLDEAKQFIDLVAENNLDDNVQLWVRRHNMRLEQNSATWKQVPTAIRS